MSVKKRSGTYRLKLPDGRIAVFVADIPADKCTVYEEGFEQDAKECTLAKGREYYKMFWDQGARRV